MAWTTAEGAPPAAEDDCFFLPSSGKEQHIETLSAKEGFYKFKALTHYTLNCKDLYENFNEKVVAHIKNCGKIVAVVKKVLWKKLHFL